MKVILDAGHGGKDAGAVSKCGMTEADYTQKIVKEVKSRLESEGYEVIETNPNNEYIKLGTRVTTVNKECKKGACVLVSVHCNSFSKESAKGWEVWSTKAKTNSDILADIFIKNMKEIMSDKTCRGHKESDFYIIKHSNCPCVLTENFFVSNPNEVDYLKSEEGFDKICKLHVDSIKEYIKLKT